VGERTEILQTGTDYLVQPSHNQFARRKRSSIRSLAALVTMGLLIGISSIVKQPPSYAGIEPLPFWGPFEFLADYSREIGTLLGALVLVWVGPSMTVLSKTSFILGLLLTHVTIFLKNTYSGAPDSTLLFFVFLLLLISISSLAGNMRRSSAGFHASIPLILGSLFFMGITIWQFLINPLAMLQPGGGERFSGMTSNPQMFSLCLSIVIPTMLFLYYRFPSYRFVALIFLPFAVFFAYLTGSRLAILITVLSVLLFYRSKIGRFFILLLPTILLAMIFFSGSEVDTQSQTDRYLSFENTREHVWVAQLSRFFENPLTGRPLPQGSRVGFSENSYLASGDSLGIVGVISLGIIVAFLIGRLRLMLRMERSHGWQPETALVASIIGTTMVGGIFEAVFYGIFTMPLIALVYVTLFAPQFLRS
jgi:hypothetical protein